MALARRREPEADRRRSILRAAVDVFSRKGYHGCRMADVARQAGVAYGLLYHYFRNKDELLQSVFESGWAGFVTRVSDALEAGEDLPAQVRGVVRVAFEAYRRDQRGVKVLLLEVGRSPSAEGVHRGRSFDEVIGLVGGAFRRAQARGEVPRSADPVLCAAALFGVIEMSLTTFVVGLAERDEAALARAEVQVTTSFLHGVLAPGLAPALPVTGAKSWRTANRASATRSRARRRG